MQGTVYGIPLDTDGTLSANSDFLVATQKATKTYADTKLPIASPTATGTLTTPAIVVSSETASTIASFDASKNIKSLALATYPSLTELSYVKGVTSAIQTQIDAKLTASNNLSDLTNSATARTNIGALFTMLGYHTTTAPADATRYYFGSDFVLSATVTPNILRIYPTRACVLKSVFLKTRCTAGNNTATTFGIRQNNTTDTVIDTTLDFSSSATNNVYTGLSISFNGTTDYFEFYYDCPTYPTINPTNLRSYAVAFFE